MMADRKVDENKSQKKSKDKVTRHFRSANLSKELDSGRREKNHSSAAGLQKVSDWAINNGLNRGWRPTERESVSRLMPYSDT